MSSLIAAKDVGVLAVVKTELKLVKRARALAIAAGTETTARKQGPCKAHDDRFSAGRPPSSTCC